MVRVYRKHLFNVYLISTYQGPETVDFIEARMLAGWTFSVWVGLTWFDVCSKPDIQLILDKRAANGLYRNLRISMKGYLIIIGVLAAK